MTDIVVTAANVIAGANAKRGHGVLDTGVTATAGQSVYIDATSGKLKLADADVLASAAAAGVTELGGGPGQRIPILLEDDDFTPGATLVQGITYVVAVTPGGICPIADLGDGDYVTHLMVAKSTTKAHLKPFVTGIALDTA